VPVRSVRLPLPRKASADSRGLGEGGWPDGLEQEPRIGRRCEGLCGVNDDVVAAVERFEKSAPISGAAFRRGGTVSLASLSDPPLQDNFDVGLIGEPAAQTIESLVLGVLHEDQLH